MKTTTPKIFILEGNFLEFKFEYACIPVTSPTHITLYDHVVKGEKKNLATVTRSENLPKMLR
jgi:hypothetical protein